MVETSDGLVFEGEVYFDGDAFTGRWQVRRAGRVVEDDAIKCLSQDAARHHVRYAAQERGFAWGE